MKFAGILLGAFVALSFIQCKRGCKDANAENYDPKAKRDDGSCVYTKDPNDFDRSPMLINIADNIIIPAYKNLKEAIDTLQDEVNAFEANPNTTTLQNLRVAWHDALVAWQYAGYYEFGPAEANFLRSNMNVYPADTAQINGNIVAGSYDLDVANNLDAKGFQALDFLLNGLGATDSEIVDQYTTASNASNRMTYLKDLIADMQSKSTTVYDTWRPSVGNYASTFKTNTGLDLGGSCNMLFNALMMHYEQFVRSGKLGIPAGALSFSQTPLPEKVECYFHGNLSKEMLLEATTALNNLYNGIGTAGDGEGFKEYLDYLETNGPSGLLSNDINTQIQTSYTSLSTSLNDPLSDFVVNNQQTALSVWNDMQTLVVLLKNDLKSAIGLSITYADADGD